MNEEKKPRRTRCVISRRPGESFSCGDIIIRFRRKNESNTNFLFVIEASEDVKIKRIPADKPSNDEA